jgi:hypothetical protein
MGEACKFIHVISPTKPPTPPPEPSACGSAVEPLALLRPAATATTDDEIRRLVQGDPARSPRSESTESPLSEKGVNLKTTRRSGYRSPTLADVPLHAAAPRPSFGSIAAMFASQISHPSQAPPPLQAPGPVDPFGYPCLPQNQSSSNHQILQAQMQPLAQNQGQDNQVLPQAPAAPAGPLPGPAYYIISSQGSYPQLTQQGYIPQATTAGYGLPQHPQSYLSPQPQQQVYLPQNHRGVHTGQQQAGYLHQQPFSQQQQQQQNQGYLAPSQQSYVPHQQQQQQQQMYVPQHHAFPTQQPAHLFQQQPQPQQAPSQQVVYVPGYGGGFYCVPPTHPF